MARYCAIIGVLLAGRAAFIGGGGLPANGPPSIPHPARFANADARGNIWREAAGIWYISQNPEETRPAFMAQTAVFDTLAAVQRLEDAGVERKHAEAYAEAIATAVHSADLATKNDMETALSATKNDMEAALAALESRLTIRFYGAQLATVALVVALLKLLP